MWTPGFLALLLPAGVQWTRRCSQALHTQPVLWVDSFMAYLGLEVGRQAGSRAVEARWIQHVRTDRIPRSETQTCLAQPLPEKAGGP